MKTEPMNRKACPALVHRLYQLTLEGVRRSDMTKQLDISTCLLKRLRNGSYPNMDAATRAAWQETFGQDIPKTGGDYPPAVDFCGVGDAVVATDIKKRPMRRYSSPAQKPTPQGAGTAVPVTASPEPQEDDMLLSNAGLRPETRAHFKLTRSPFVDDVQSSDDVFQTPSVRYIRAALTDCAQHHGFIAVVGESGAGKSTLAEDLHERIKTEGRDIVLIKPYVLGMEDNDERGKTLKSTQIAEAICVALDPGVTLKLSTEGRFKQVHGLLVDSRRAGRRHLLVIEEAHCLPIATLKHLKRFLELKDGMQRLLGVALIGQPELRARLSGQDPQVREVAQRCEVVELEPLDAELEGYLAHKFARFDVKLDDVFAPDAFDAIRARLIQRPRGGKATDVRSLCYPLVVNNLVCRAMNAAAVAAWPKVDAQVVEAC